MGTKKYPKENYYDEFISKHGGYDNASTGDDYTEYHFDIQNEAFAGILDIWSQFFKSPLLKEGSLAREMNAVNNEYKKEISTEEWSTMQIE